MLTPPIPSAQPLLLPKLMAWSTAPRMRSAGVDGLAALYDWRNCDSWLEIVDQLLPLPQKPATPLIVVSRPLRLTASVGSIV